MHSILSPLLAGMSPFTYPIASPALMGYSPTELWESVKQVKQDTKAKGRSLFSALLLF